MIPGLSSFGSSYSVMNKRMRIMSIDGASEKGTGGVGLYRMSRKMDYDTKDTCG